jgi:hypothetical protein
LREPDGSADRGVPQSPRTELTGDYPTRIQADSQLQRHAIAARHLDRQLVRRRLDGERGKAAPKSVIFQGNWRPEQRHHAVAGEFHGAAVTLYHRRRSLGQLGHDLAQALGVQGRRDVHRSHYVGKQHRDLLVLCRVERRHQL